MGQIGSFIICDDASLRLANRPLPLGLHELENQGIPVNIPRDYLYLSTDWYVVDILAYHDNRLRHPPNALNDANDFVYQTSILTAMRAIHPFFFLTDLHASNIFVDDKWHIAGLVDLEWGCSQPAEMIHPPHWFDQHAVDCVDPVRFGKLHQEFMRILAAEEAEMFSGEKSSSQLLSDTMKYGLGDGHLLTIQPPLTKHCREPENHPFYRVMTWYWAKNNIQTCKRKRDDKKAYDEKLRKVFLGMIHSSSVLLDIFLHILLYQARFSFQ
ncbi:hypothetical protein BJY01DRAFT_248110 [Aspergillus pseudoustus]|uniref:Aminoglycoside phosphotransferase domain-containing protein n=1 Tax=Aspergillus pseudoustus TaxID=1810923 RepID=A0ABR4JWQ4_9EURO